MCRVLNDQKIKFWLPRFTMCNQINCESHQLKSQITECSKIKQFDVCDLIQSCWKTDYHTCVLEGDVWPFTASRSSISSRLTIKEMSRDFNSSISYWNKIIILRIMKTDKRYNDRIHRASYSSSFKLDGHGWAIFTIKFGSKLVSKL